MKIKLLHTDEGTLLFSKAWPEIPEVQASIYKDAALMNDFDNRMRFALRYAIPVKNPDVAFAKIAFNEAVERGKFYEIECEYKVHYADGYFIEIEP